MIGFVFANTHDMIFIETEKGIIESIDSNDIRYNDRYSNGSFLFDESESGKAKTIWKIEQKKDSIK